MILLYNRFLYKRFLLYRLQHCTFSLHYRPLVLLKLLLDGLQELLVRREGLLLRLFQLLYFRALDGQQGRDQPLAILVEELWDLGPIWCLKKNCTVVENDRNPNVCYLPKPNILLKPNYSATTRIQNSTYPIVQICHYLVWAEYSVSYSAEYFGRNMFRS